MKITEQFILLQSPNPGAAANGRKLSQKGSFSAHGRTEDAQLYWADCAGSGKNPYHTSVDFSASESAPTCRCSCPSRQFPCKHAVGLMYEILAGRNFPVTQIPDDLAQKREKKAARAAKKEENTEKTGQPKKTNTAAQRKKVERQLEGLSRAEKMVDELLHGGIAALAGASAQSFEKLAKDLGNYYLTGPQTAFSRIALAVRRIRQEPELAQEHYADALGSLIGLHATIKKARVFLNGKLESGDFSSADSILHEALGGIWRLEDLRAAGAYRENARLVQLSFDVSYDEARLEFVERGFWLDLDRGALCQTLNYRPVKALKYVKADDSCFELLEVPVLYEYPGELNRRVRWEGCTSRPLTANEQAGLADLAEENLQNAVKLAKNQMKNTLLPKYIPVLLKIGRVGTVEGTAVLEDRTGNRIVLRDRREDGEDHASAHRLMALPVAVTDGMTLFGLMFYDESDRRICLQPYSLLTSDRVIRLQY